MLHFAASDLGLPCLPGTYRLIWVNQHDKGRSIWFLNQEKSIYIFGIIAIEID